MVILNLRETWTLKQNLITHMMQDEREELLFIFYLKIVIIIQNL